MTSTLSYLLAKNYARTGRVKPLTRLDAKALIFQVGNICQVVRNEKGWMCDAITRKKNGEAWSCSYSKKEESCWHVLACRMYLERFENAKKRIQAERRT